MRVLPVVGIASCATLVPGLLLALTAGQMVMIAPVVHMAVVGAAGALALLAAIALSLIASRVNDGRAVLLGMAFSVMATMLVVHALATPGAIHGENGLVQLAGALNLPVGAAILSALALPALRRPRHVGRLLRMHLALVAALILAGTAALLDPGRIPLIPRPGSDAARLVFAAGAGALALLAWRSGRTYVLTRRASDLLVTVGLVWLIAAQYGLLHYGVMDAPWWVAHGLEVAGIGLVGVPAALDLRHGVASRPLVGDLRPVDLVADEEAFLGGRVRALMLRLAAKDASTEGHTRRVAALAAQVGEQLGLPERRLRLLVLGGLLHDMGKLAVPDDILNKPGRLSADEFDIIRRHPAWGRELLLELGGFAPLVLRLVESHHERLDARGYPNRRTASDLELEVRILTVADVYDALTADRVYRKAWSPSRAFELIEANTGTAFDGVCVHALRHVLTRPAPVASLPVDRANGHRADGLTVGTGVMARPQHVFAFGAELGLSPALQRVGASSAALGNARPLGRAHSVAQRARSWPNTANSVWGCEIAWRPRRVRSRFQAVMVPPDGRTLVVAESKGLPWPPKDGRELTTALDALVASIVAAGWEPVQSGGAWYARRFLWRQEGEPPAKL
jgi:HD-GYP domain-containing protein (c-di-GMP phosphodiesterase class II)